jgi:hypothetical protein
MPPPLTRNIEIRNCPPRQADRSVRLYPFTQLNRIHSECRWIAELTAAN